MTILLTGVAGFLGMHVTEALLGRGETVVGIDDLNGAYDPSLKEARLRRLVGRTGLRVVRGDITDRAVMSTALDEDDSLVTAVVHLAGQTSSHRAFPDPATRIRDRVERHVAILDLCRDRLNSTPHLVHVVPERDALPEATGPRGAVSVRPGIPEVEVTLGRAFARCHRIAQTALRLPPVYGPWGRPDAMCHRLADAVAAGRPVFLPDPDLERPGPLYVDDAVTAILTAVDRPPTLEVEGLHRLVDVAPGARMPLERLLAAVEKASGRTARRLRVPSEAIEPAHEVEPGPSHLAPSPALDLEAGAERFVAWHREWQAAATTDRRPRPA